jgi:hypothetical protein
MLQEIEEELQKPAEKRTSVPQSKVRKWMESKDTESLGATYVFLSKAEHVDRVTPPLAFDPVFDFLLKYFEFCLTANPKSERANSAYSAGYDLVGWFVWMWDEKRDKKYFEAIKSLLSRLYVSGTPELKKCIEHGIVEHLFERKAIRNFFGDWKDDPNLRPAYEEGMLWIKGGGSSPLTERKQKRD